MPRQMYIKILQTQFGSIGARGDEKFEYEIESNMPEEMVKKFCTVFLKPCSVSNDVWEENEKKINSDPRIHFSGYYYFVHIGENNYRYGVYIPWND